MLPAWIIEEIRKRERERCGRDERPCVELPRPDPPPSQRPSNPPRDDPERDGERDEAVVVIELN
jgi:hypothetical protein